VPVVVVALLVAMVAVAAARKLRIRGHEAPVAPTPTVLVHVPDEAGPPPPAVDDAGAPGAVRDARMLHGDARHTNRAAGRAPTSEPAVAWAHDVGGPVEAQVVASPDGQTLYAASLGGALTALARADGAVLWTFALGERAYATPCVAEDGTIYAASDAKKVVALTPEGKTRWTLDTDDEADTGIELAKDGTIVFAAGRKVYGVTQGGFVKFRFAAKRKVFASPAIAPDGRVYLGSQDHHAYGLTAEGGPRWSVDLGADVDGAPVIGDDGAVYVGTDGGEVVRLDPDGGRVVWRRGVGGFVRGTLSMTRAGEVAVGVYGPRPGVLVLAPEDGATRLELRIPGTGAREFGVHGGPLEDDQGLLLFGAQDDEVRAIDRSGRVLWTFAAQADVDAPVTLLDDGSLVVASDDGKVYLLRGK
jgi:outer membrane protein assembly factor BamB